MESILLNQDTVYCLTYKKFIELIDTVKGTLDTLSTSHIALPDHLKCLKHVKGLAVCSPLVPLHTVPRAQVFYMLGNLDIKSTVEALLKHVPLSKYGCYERSACMLKYDNAQASNVTDNTSVILSFELFKNADELAKHFDWLIPTAVYTKSKVYISYYSMMCLKKGIVLASSRIKTFDRVSSEVWFWNDKNGRVGAGEESHCPYCAYCQRWMYPFGVIDLEFDPSHTYLFNTVLGANHSQMPYTLSSNKWDSEHFDDCHLSYYLPYPCLDEIKSLVKDPKYKGLEPLLKPLKVSYIDPIPYEKALCILCKPHYKPVWSFKRAHFYQELSVSLYLILSKQAIPWDLVLLITELYVNSGHYQAFKRAIL